MAGSAALPGLIGDTMKYYPWGHFPGPTAEERDYCARGLHYWEQVADHVILTTRHVHNYVDLFYSALNVQECNVSIIGGIETYDLLSNHMLDGWQEVADVAQRISRLTGSELVLLDNEVAFQRAGTVDPDKLHRALQPLRESGVAYLLYQPEIWQNTEHYCIALLQAFAIPHSYSIASYLNWDWLLGNGNEIARRTRHGSVVDEYWNRFLVTGDGTFTTPRGEREVYTPEEFLAIMTVLGDTRPCIVYPGHNKWESAGKAFAELPHKMTSAEWAAKLAAKLEE